MKKKWAGMGSVLPDENGGAYRVALNFCGVFFHHTPKNFPEKIFAAKIYSTVEIIYKHRLLHVMQNHVDGRLFRIETKRNKKHSCRNKMMKLQSVHYSM